LFVENLIEKLVGNAVETALSRLELALNYGGLFWNEWKRKFLLKKVVVRSVKIGRGFGGDFGGDFCVEKRG